MFITIANFVEAVGNEYSDRAMFFLAALLTWFLLIELFFGDRD